MRGGQTRIVRTATLSRDMGESHELLVTIYGASLGSKTDLLPGREKLTIGRDPAADISLEDVQKHLKSTVGEIYLVSAAGRVIAHPNAQLRMSKAYPGEELRSLPGGARVAASPSGNAFVPYGASSRTLVWATASITGWKVVISIP